MRPFLAFALLLAFAGAASAADGVREINQSSVSGDASALHIISAPGSYRLTSDLVVPNILTGIRIGVGDVTLDLNGFTISSQNPAGSTFGILGSVLTNVEIRNGTIRNFATSGVHLPNGLLHRVIDVRVIGNGMFGINVIGAGPLFGGHLIRGCTALGNSTGIRVEPEGSLVIDSIARNNSPGFGLNLGAETAYGRNVAAGNSADVIGGIPVECNLIGVAQVCPP